MNITIGNYQVKTGTKFGFDIYENKKSAVKVDGVETGELKDTEVWIGFYGNLQAVSDKLFWLGMSDSDAKTLEEVLTVVGATRHLIKTAGLTCEDEL